MIEDRIAVDLDRMARAARDALAFTAGMTEADFLDDRKTQAAVVMTLLIIGEAASRIAARSPDFVASNPDLPWNAMRGMRNRAAHGYETIRFDVVWETLHQSVPALISAIDKLGPLGPQGTPPQIGS